MGTTVLGTEPMFEELFPFDFDGLADDDEDGLFGRATIEDMLSLALDEIFAFP
jgi:hypothetical protein